MDAHYRALLRQPHDKDTNVQAGINGVHYLGCSKGTAEKQAGDDYYADDDNNKVKNAQCVFGGQKVIIYVGPRPVNGKWGEWSECSGPCGEQQRACDNPPPENGGTCLEPEVDLSPEEYDPYDFGHLSGDYSGEEDFADYGPYGSDYTQYPTRFPTKMRAEWS